LVVANVAVTNAFATSELPPSPTDPSEVTHFTCLLDTEALATATSELYTHSCFLGCFANRIFLAVLGAASHPLLMIWIGLLLIKSNLSTIH
jgi:hypothetical protein